MSHYVITFKGLYRNEWNRKDLVNGRPKITRKVIGTAKLECAPTGFLLRFRHAELIEKAWEEVSRIYKAAGYEQVFVERRRLEPHELFDGEVAYIG